MSDAAVISSLLVELSTDEQQLLAGGFFGRRGDDFYGGGFDDGYGRGRSCGFPCPRRDRQGYGGFGH